MKPGGAAGGLLAAVFCLCSACGTAPAAPARRAKGGAPLTIYLAKNPAQVPAFTLRDLDGHLLSSSQWRGRVVLLNFWATWCGPCRIEIPELVALQKKYQGSLEVVGLSVDDSPAREVKKFAEALRVNYPVAVASLALQEKFGGVVALPTSFLINRDGGVVQKHIGLFPPNVYEAEVRALLGLPVDANVETFEDRGQVWLANASKANELPGVDLSKLTPQQTREALRALNTKRCTCGCSLTLAQCRIVDTNCPVSAKLAQEMVDRIAGGPAPAHRKAQKN